MSFSYKYNYPQIAKEAGFKLRQYKDGPLDWRLIGSVEIERILKEQSVEQIDAVLNHLCEVPLGSILESNILDSGIAKYFILSQFAIQYLLFCRQFMEDSNSDLREAHGSAQIELTKLKNSLNEANNEIINLHKKINHIEAVHEIIYPCHLCSKNFISNDALNLHISRKHNKYNSNVAAKSESHQSDTNAYPKEKDREMDVNLINAIKLELEIKHLKERLNKAEREIKENCIHNNNGNIKVTPEKPDDMQCTQNINNHHNETADKIITTQSIGIQSNLMDVKDTDDYNKEGMSNEFIVQQQKEQFLILETKLNEFNEWKEKQKQENSDFLQRIYQKLQYLIDDYEKSTTEMLNKVSQPTTSVDHIEQLFNIKFDDINKNNEIKLIEMINRLEMNFKEKINNMKEESRKKEEDVNSVKQLIKSSNKSFSNSELSSPNQSDFNNRTYDIPNGITNIPKNNDAANTGKRKLLDNTTKVAYGSGNTKIHIKQDDVPTKGKQSYRKLNERYKQESSDSTDISGNIQMDNHESDTNKDNDSDSMNENNGDNDSDKSYSTDSDVSSNYETEPETTSKMQTLENQQQMIKEKQKLQAKENVNKILKQRLSDLGLNENTKAISNTAFIRLQSDLQEKRYHLKKKYPKFHATRCKIKKFVDKLCSSKMPPKAEVILKETEAFKTYKSTEQLNVKASTPLNDDIKERLERILASPIRKPSSTYYPSTQQTKAIIHKPYDDNIKPMSVPIPMPRKRVMFDAKKEAAYELTENSSSGT